MLRTPLTRRQALLTSAAALAGFAIPAHADPGPIAPIQQLVETLLRVMKSGTGTPFGQRFDILAPVIDHVFDLDAILRASVGPVWASLSPTQQDTLRPVFRRYTVASYLNNFNNFNGQQFTVDPQTRPVGNNEQVVRTRITPLNGDSHKLDYVMQKTDNGWRAVDVLAEGAISRVAVQRSDFRRLLARGGAPALAATLASKSQDLSDGMS